jgi:hypothetical protein
MAKKRVKGGQGKPVKPSPLAEVLQQLEAMKSDASASGVRLHADLARDTVEELFGKLRLQLRNQARQIRRLQDRSDKWRYRLTELLHDLSTGPVILPRAAAHPPASHEQLIETFRQLERGDFLELAKTLHDAAGASDVPAYLRFLVDEILVKGSRIVAEHLVRHASGAHPPQEENEFMERLRNHVAGNVCQGLARLVNYQVTPEVGEHLDRVIVTVLHFLNDLLTATPPGRLLISYDDSPFDPERHQPIHGRPSTGDLKVSATLFPGYVILSDPPQVVEKAQVYTDRVQPEKPA